MVMKDEMMTALELVETLQEKICSISNKVDVLAVRFNNMKNDRDRLKAMLDLLNLPDRPCNICRNRVDGECSKWSCEWEDLR
jgi:hypothetical protein